MLAWIQASLQFDQTKMMDSYAQGLCTLSLQTDMLFPWLHCLKGREVPIPARTRMYPELQNTTSRFHKEGCWQHNFCGQVSKRKVSGQFWICSVASVFFFFLCELWWKTLWCVTAWQGQETAMAPSLDASALNTWKKAFSSRRATPQIISTRRAATVPKLVLEG